ncbi:MAG: VanZ family protein [Bacteroidia bacterium]
MLKAFKISILLAVIILILSIMPVPQMPKLGVKAGDKIGHFLAYVVLSFAVLFEIARKFRWSNIYRRWLSRAVLICILYGVILECLQASSLFNRHFDIYDMLANTIGVVTGSTLFILAFSRIKKIYIK